METENKITLNNLISALFFLVLGIILLTTNDNIVSIVSKVIGGILILVGLVKSVQYIYLKGKLGDYDVKELVTGIFIICIGVLFILFASTLGLAIRLIVGIWTLFAGINRLILALSVRNTDKLGFRMYFGSALIMITVGVLLTSGLFDKLVGVFIIIYAVSEIVDYVYSKVSDKKDFSTKRENKKQKRLKNTKVVDAIVEEEK